MVPLSWSLWNYLSKEKTRTPTDICCYDENKSFPFRLESRMVKKCLSKNRPRISWKNFSDSSSSRRSRNKFPSKPYWLEHDDKIVDRSNSFEIEHSNRHVINYDYGMQSVACMWASASIVFNNIVCVFVWLFVGCFFSTSFYGHLRVW